MNRFIYSFESDGQVIAVVFNPERMSLSPTGDYANLLAATDTPPAVVYNMIATVENGTFIPTYTRMDKIINPPAGIRTGWALTPTGTWGPPDLRPEIRATVDARNHYEEETLIDQLTTATCQISLGQGQLRLLKRLTLGITDEQQQSEYAADIAATSKDLEVLQAQRNGLYSRALPVRILHAHIEGLGVGQSDRHTADAAETEASALHAAVIADTSLNETHHDHLIAHLRAGRQTSTLDADGAAALVRRVKAGMLPHQAKAAA